ncbi:rRNA methyltransferase 2, mitochondrial-like isoform X2 [Daphnia pulex]|uniref:rRNA methyltransferase 2, mitochondrial-like isoform X2 n=1 Tax=Daphnia pulex TaxID=6669 RepID=UPI001EE137A9|nr:rRNA methyltransferase 2, mitochondrial-like isoform X2 [Daphnia pulex]XP_046640517.1 rRNA methyltransferase 2, mitochondrial-like isoform X2 [Daphnia pulicaria]
MTSMFLKPKWKIIERARSAFKLIEIDDKHKFLKPGDVVVECGAAPGAWTQVCVKRINATGKVSSQLKGKHVAVDLQPMYPIEGAVILAPLDFTKSLSQTRITEILGGQLANAVLSDMAPAASGIRDLDQDRILELAYSVLRYAQQISMDGATLLIKLWAGGRIKQLENEIALHYSQVKVVKPPSSRQDSAEMFILASNFKKNT